MARLRGITFPTSQLSLHMMLARRVYYGVIETEMLNSMHAACTVGRDALAARDDVSLDSGKAFMRQQHEALFLNIPYVKASSGGMTKIEAERLAAIAYYQEHYIMKPKPGQPVVATTKAVSL